MRELAHEAIRESPDIVMEAPAALQERQVKAETAAKTDVQANAH
ncbi:hypothetical protein OEZ60_11315 [Defluviimonas sp. WL0024]|uniref:Uncharacterized protein n=1 Tax=Albidovulum salinarum TaxID=2984153 RepID=A0ABT2X4N7_9RHOB|nr:hypothetical protein [Defluviimonas salinarum]MCU9848600.1 hypothetical protein [Defluviimonas sp. WL0024]